MLLLFEPLLLLASDLPRLGFHPDLTSGLACPAPGMEAPTDGNVGSKSVGPRQSFVFSDLWSRPRAGSSCCSGDGAVLEILLEGIDDDESDELKLTRLDSLLPVLEVGVDVHSKLVAGVELPVDEVDWRLC